MAGLTKRNFAEIGNSIQRELDLSRGHLIEDPRLDTPERQNEQPMYLGKFEEDVAKGAFGRFEIWVRGDGIKGTETASGQFIESVFSRTDNLTSIDLAYAFYLDGGYEANKAEC